MITPTSSSNIKQPLHAFQHKSNQTLLLISSKYSLSLTLPFCSSPSSLQHFIKHMSGMSFAGSPDSDPWSSQLDTYTRDCSKGICSFYCPQWCPIVFPSPPPPGGDSHAALSPLVIALIAALSSAFLLLAYYTVVSKYCRRRRRRRREGRFNDDNATDADLEGGNLDHQQWQQQQLAGSRGLDEALIKAITVCKYKKGDGLVEGTDCSVCLSEFREEESLRLLPKCNHAFHVFCIDAWLKAHNNCPLCRSNIAPLYSNPSPSPADTAETAAETAAALGPRNPPESHPSSLQIQRRSEALVMVVEDLESVRREEIIVVTSVAKSKTPSEARRRDEENNEEREISQSRIEIVTVQEEEGSDSSSQHRGLRSIADASRSDGDDLQIGNCCRSSSMEGIGSSTQIGEEEEEEGKSNSRVPKHKGKDFIIPN